MLKHNTYFEGKVQSIGFERNGRRQTSGVIDAGEFHFGTDAAERMTVVSGELSSSSMAPPNGRATRRARHSSRSEERLRRAGRCADRLPLRVSVKR